MAGRHGERQQQQQRQPLKCVQRQLVMQELGSRHDIVTTVMQQVTFASPPAAPGGVGLVQQQQHGLGEAVQKSDVTHGVTTVQLQPRRLAQVHDVAVANGRCRRGALGAAALLHTRARQLRGAVQCSSESDKGVAVSAGLQCCDAAVQCSSR